MYCKILIKIEIYYILHCYYISHCYTGLLFLLDYLCYRPGTFDDWFTMKNIHIDNFFRKPYENFLHTNKSCLTVYHDCFICKIIVLKLKLCQYRMVSDDVSVHWTFLICWIFIIWLDPTNKKAKLWRFWYLWPYWHLIYIRA